MQEEPYGEVFLINKPLEWTSFDVVKKVRNALRIKKVGHAGTLDPLATGLLIVCAGKMTKQIDSFMGQEKEYTGTFVIGATTDSFDLEQPIVPVSDPSNITIEQVKVAVAELTGDILQIPPMHSAIKVDGKRVYESARKGKEVKMDPRPVTVSVFEITKFDNPTVEFRIVCSKGTYIRSLARDLGEKLTVGAYMSSLCRTRIGNFKLSEAHELLSLVEEIKARTNENL
ncbi:tRNA pseudouridine(55) synthase TruB [Algoriphagus persicinus]|uniref:tRNA pseudouridine(55) synthase TruB n=1 Tax=Algoriphagus persicinus TaxID=3108754 RepID=UPI002B37F58E|nr:tRNA pseudouridine(55) synthase TruB [Algoriphagus sp. E1-3-M2]MEB2784179.1 tRNA pseudouridine(55) synthase TruB [Algoriphagus sp. E1-3-M2]